MRSAAAPSSDTVDTIMTPGVVTVGESTTLYEVRSRFREGRFRHVFVTNTDGAVAGVLSDRDLLEASSPFFDTPTESRRDVHALWMWAGEAVKREPVIVRTDTTVQEAARKLLGEEISCLPMLEPEGNVAGIVTSSDIMRYTADRA